MRFNIPTMDYKFNPKKLREARRAADISQADLAISAGVSRETVANWERGDTWPDANRIALVCSRLGVDPSTLYQQ